MSRNSGSVSVCGCGVDETASVVLLWRGMSGRLSLSVVLTVLAGFPQRAAAHVLPPGGPACTHTLPFTPRRTNSLSLPLSLVFLFYFIISPSHTLLVPKENEMGIKKKKKSMKNDQMLCIIRLAANFSLQQKLTI